MASKILWNLVLSIIISLNLVDARHLIPSIGSIDYKHHHPQDNLGNIFYIHQATGPNSVQLVLERPNQFFTPIKSPSSSFLDQRPTQNQVKVDHYYAEESTQPQQILRRNDNDNQFLNSHGASLASFILPPINPLNGGNFQFNRNLNRIQSPNDFSFNFNNAAREILSNSTTQNFRTGIQGGLLRNSFLLSNNFAAIPAEVTPVNLNLDRLRTSQMESNGVASQITNVRPPINLNGLMQIQSNSQSIRRPAVTSPVQVLAQPLAGPTDVSNDVSTTTTTTTTTEAAPITMPMTTMTTTDVQDVQQTFNVKEEIDPIPEFPLKLAAFLEAGLNSNKTEATDMPLPENMSEPEEDSDEKVNQMESMTMIPMESLSEMETEMVNEPESESESDSQKNIYEPIYGPIYGPSMGEESIGNYLDVNPMTIENPTNTIVYEYEDSPIVNEDEESNSEIVPSVNVYHTSYLSYE